jgi:hypothetical protein
VTNLAGSAHGAQQVAASTLFQASDPDADAITQYELWDPAAGNGQLVLNGQAQVARQVITVDAADFAALDWDSTGQSGPAILAVRASDGTLWSDWTTVTVGSRNAAPTVAALDPTVDIGQAVAPASLFQATDPDGDAIAKYEFWDPAAGNGGFTLNGTAQAARQVLSVSSLAGLAWDTTGQDGTAVFAMRASDGSAWSDWTTVSVDAIPPAAGVVINIAIDPIGPIPPLTPLPAGTTPYDPSQLVTALATSAADQNGTVTTPLAPATEPLPTLAASHG